MSTWIFQGNPKVFDLRGYLDACSGVFTWSVAKYADQIAVGDSVYIWQSQGDDPSSAGAIAEGTVVEAPKLQLDDVVSAKFWQGPFTNVEEMRVRVRLNRLAKSKEVLKRNWMKDDSVLRDLLIMKQPAGTTFPVTTAQSRRLGQLWRNTGTDWSRDEVVAAIWLYDQLQDQEISKIAGSQVEQLAQKLGRAPSGVYNKLMNIRSIDPHDARMGFDGGSKIDQKTWGEFFDAATSALDKERLQKEYARLWSDEVVSDKLSDEVLTAEVKRLEAKPLNELLSEYKNCPKISLPSRRSQSSVVFDRNPLVVALRKRLSGYQCEVPNCQSEKFKTESGDFYVEVHHLVPLADGGADRLENTAALCPTHHRLLHHAADRDPVRAALVEKRNVDAKFPEN
jgi:5-methylcytosine-specific restriction endonuclease McrA